MEHCRRNDVLAALATIEVFAGRGDGVQSEHDLDCRADRDSQKGSSKKRSVPCVIPNVAGLQESMPCDALFNQT